VRVTCTILRSLEESKRVGDRVRASLSWGFTLAHTQPAACDSAAALAAAHYSVYSNFFF